MPERVLAILPKIKDGVQELLSQDPIIFSPQINLKNILGLNQAVKSLRFLSDLDKNVLAQPVYVLNNVINQQANTGTKANLLVNAAPMASGASINLTNATAPISTPITLKKINLFILMDSTAGAQDADIFISADQDGGGGCNIATVNANTNGALTRDVFYYFLDFPDLVTSNLSLQFVGGGSVITLSAMIEYSN